MSVTIHLIDFHNCGKGIVGLQLLKIFHPARAAERAIAYGSHSLLTMKQPKIRRPEGI